MDKNMQWHVAPTETKAVSKITENQAPRNTYLVGINGQPVGPWVIEHIAVDKDDRILSVWIGRSMVEITISTHPTQTVSTEVRTLI